MRQASPLKENEERLAIYQGVRCDSMDGGERLRLRWRRQWSDVLG